ncbi:MAG: hypothetical protein KAT83_03980, partial [Candidatus Aenigmarchaeota archaeon]|nr:hypothetical protein [Candidatus Aenigmarchaeota archaeon]
LIGDNGPEHDSVRSIHKTRAGALKAWNELRLELLEDAKEFLKNETCTLKELWLKMIKNLECEDPDTIDNYPHETPYIQEWDVEED